MNIVGKYCATTSVFCFSLFESGYRIFRYSSVRRMGLLSEGNPLSWSETKALAEHVRQHGVEQFINIFKKLADRRGDVLKWGDEVSNLQCSHDIPT